MRNYLTHKKLWHCVIEQDPTNSSLDDNVALSTIQYSISPELLPHIMYAQNAQQAWVWLAEAAAASAQEKEKYDDMRVLAAKALANVKSKKVRPTDKFLTQRNYKSWSVYMKNVLTSEYLWGIVDGSETSGARGYRLKSECTCTIIKELCSSQMWSYISPETDGKTVWDKLAAAAENLAAEEKLAVQEKLAADAAAAEKLAADEKLAVEEKLAAYVAAAEKLIADAVAEEEKAAAETAAKVAASYVAKLSKVAEADKVLKRGNYQKWSAYMKILLESQHLWDVVEGSDDSGAHDRETKRTSAFQTIRKACGEEMLAYIFRINNVTSLWDKLGAIHKDEYIKYSLLLHAIQKEGFREYIGRNGNLWEGTITYLETNPEAVTAYITEDGSPALHVAVGLGRVNFVKDLLSKMVSEELEMKTRQGSAAISIAAEGNNMEIVEMMVNKNSGLLLIENEHGHIPLVTAAINANEEMMRCLYSKTTAEKICELSDKRVATFLTAAARLEAYDIVLDLLGRRPEYGITKDDSGVTLLTVMAEKPSAFPSGNCGGSLQNVIRWSVHHCKFRVPGVKQQIDNIMKQCHAILIVRRVCELLLDKDLIQLTEVGADKAIHLATINGIVEVFDNLLDSNPYLVRFKDDDGRGLFQIAVMYRQVNIFQYICQMRHKNMSAAVLDNNRNNILHCVASLSPSRQLDRVTGAALQMQREIQWFLELEKVVQPRYREMENADKEKPKALFSREHKNLMKEGEMWMKETSSACMIVSTLIATIMFAAAFTLPGGNDQNTGYPMFSKSRTFIVFIVCDAVSLFASCTSVMTFFTILTARYAENDFLVSLPRKLILGLFSLFISIATMMATFAATLVLILSKHASWIYIPVIILASIPVLLFAYLQFPLFRNIIMSTYGPGIFHRKKSILCWRTFVPEILYSRNLKDFVRQFSKND
ncbi:hypothetical protein MKW98_005696 [Papaver atlanticum]|uniref:PGG domain-containing protein n=1 Tax=Papaver atlanticum TaxID=357466 RepID=A0AAD4XHC0_9MAGN|nr:hypothetical protein MKW98_005696 [Papaver atlanticum]